MKSELSKEFNSFYAEYFSNIFRYVFRFIGNYQEAEQITQQVFVNLYEYLKTSSEIEYPKAYVHRIAHNICINFLKRKKKSDEIMTTSNALSYSNCSDYDQIVKEQRTISVRESILKLPRRDQKCIFLYQEGFSYAEIAHSTGIKQTAISKTLSRAIERLSRQIKNGEKS
jgi:RNA polymerase sigma-70 factor (ECF subfamily)